MCVQPVALRVPLRDPQIRPDARAHQPPKLNPKRGNVRDEPRGIVTARPAVGQRDELVASVRHHIPADTRAGPPRTLEGAPRGIRSVIKRDANGWLPASGHPAAPTLQRIRIQAKRPRPAGLSRQPRTRQRPVGRSNDRKQRAVARHRKLHGPGPIRTPCRGDPALARRGSFTSRGGGSERLGS